MPRYLVLPVLFFLVTAHSAHGGSQPGLRSEWGRETARCLGSHAAKPSDKHVWIFKQWHLAPSVATQDLAKAAALPQAKNQTAIFQQLDAWLSQKAIDAVVAEGCSGELARDSGLRFNGWSIQELEAASMRPHYDDQVVAHVPMKLEAKHGQAVKTVCGDDPALMRENALAFSDARGVVGFMTRLEQYRNDPGRAKTYLEGVIELYHLPKETTHAQAMKRLGEELRSALKRVHAAIDLRNEKAVEVLSAIPERQVAVVFGGMHAPGLMRSLEKKGIVCTVVEPAGYQDDEAQLLSRLDELVKQL